VATLARRPGGGGAEAAHEATATEDAMTDHAAGPEAGRWDALAHIVQAVMRRYAQDQQLTLEDIVRLAVAAAVAAKDAEIEHWKASYYPLKADLREAHGQLARHEDEKAAAVAEEQERVRAFCKQPSGQTYCELIGMRPAPGRR
jgi:hypothetical protein